MIGEIIDPACKDDQRSESAEQDSRSARARWSCASLVVRIRPASALGQSHAAVAVDAHPDSPFADGGPFMGMPNAAASSAKRVSIILHSRMAGRWRAGREFAATIRRDEI